MIAYKGMLPETVTMLWAKVIEKEDHPPVFYKEELTGERTKFSLKKPYYFVLWKTGDIYAEAGAAGWLDHEYMSYSDGGSMELIYHHRFDYEFRAVDYREEASVFQPVPVDP